MHRICLAAQFDEASPGQLLLGLLDERSKVSQHAAQVAAAHTAKHVYYRHHVVMGRDGRTAGALHGSKVREDLGIVLAGPAGTDRDRLERGNRIDRVLRHSYVHQVLDTVFRVEPVVGLYLTTSAQAQKHRVGHITLGNADLRRFGAVDGEVELRLV